MAADIVGDSAAAAGHRSVWGFFLGNGKCDSFNCQRISYHVDFLAPIKNFKNLLTAIGIADIIFEKTKQSVCPLSPQDTVPKG